MSWFICFFLGWGSMDRLGLCFVLLCPIHFSFSEIFSFFPFFPPLPLSLFLKKTKMGVTETILVFNYDIDLPATTSQNIWDIHEIFSVDGHHNFRITRRYSHIAFLLQRHHLFVQISKRRNPGGPP